MPEAVKDWHKAIPTCCVCHRLALKGEKQAHAHAVRDCSHLGVELDTAGVIHLSISAS